jgi:tellurite resistance protein TerC
VVFAIDSVPAVFALTRETFIVFTSNVFAILGLRSMFFMLALVLVFVGLKMVWLDAAFGGKFPIGVSLALIAALLAGSVVASRLVRPRRRPAAAPRPSKEPASW